MKKITITNTIKNENEDLDQEIAPETHDSMYLMHRFFARKPANVISYYIEKYSKPNEIILDPFMGSGVSVIEALIKGRMAVGLDLNPISHFITENTAKMADMDLLKESFQVLKKKIFEESDLYDKLYHILCPQCQNVSEITHLLWDFKDESKNIPQLKEIRIKCINCKDIIITTENFPNEFEGLKEIILQQEYNALEFGKECNLQPPEFKFQYSTQQKFLQLRHHLRKQNELSTLFSQRNLVFLTFIRNSLDILDNKYDSVKSLLKFCFSSAVGQASKMVWVIDERKGNKLARRQVGSWTHHFYWDPYTYFEVNAWACFKERFGKMLKGKENSNNRFSAIDAFPFQTSNQFDTLSSQNPILMIQKSATQIPLPDDCIDFIFTDPPYGDSIQYGELCALWGAWLGLDMQKYNEQMEAEEIIINKHQNKDLHDYQSRITQAFQECFRVLKPERYMEVTFHNTEFEIRNSIISAGLTAGFELKQIIHQMPPRVSVKALLHYQGSPIGDYYIRFQKHIQENHEILPVEIKDPVISNSYLFDQIKSLIEYILVCRGEPTSFLEISNHIDEYFCQIRLFPMPQFDDVLKQIQKSGNFVIDAKGNWWFSDPESFTIEPPLSDRIYNALVDILDSPTFKTVEQPRSIKHLNQRIFNMLYDRFRGVYTPDKVLVNKILEKLIQGKSGKKKKETYNSKLD